MIATILRVVTALELAIAAGLAHWLHWEDDWSAGAAIAAGIGLPLSVHAFIVATNFGIAAWAASPTPAAHRLTATRALRLCLREFVDSFMTFQLRMPWMAGRPLPGDERSPAAGEAGVRDAIPVVLLHGYLCNRQLWRPIAGRLSARGHAIDAMDLEPVFGPIDDYVPLIEAAVERLRRRTGAQRVALVCHSMGGLAARAYLRARGDAAIACVVTLGTPHRGTFHARFGHGPNARQMRPDSDWLRGLAAAEAPALRARFTIVLSHHDNIVAPQAVQVLPDAKVVEFSAIGHLSLALDARVADVVEGALRGCGPVA
jgi:triacylglycerol esterase/lipase EstA (alpha/beta hydrolase family)